MNTPIFDFVNEYIQRDVSRLHMPGHKGCGRLGFEKMDITEIEGADSLFHADGIINESENNATRLFGSGRTFFSTEGSTHCIKTMISIARSFSCEIIKKDNLGEKNSQDKSINPGKIIALRNVHKAFINACALLDLDIQWIFPEKDNNSICECKVSMDLIRSVIESSKAFALYVTSPDYLGNILDIKELADICHANGKLLLVDNAHGSYLNFLEESLHPMALGADLCSDSAHKTLPVLTGGAYLHLSDKMALMYDKAKDHLALFGSTSPSYLIMESLDLCNVYIEEHIREDLINTSLKVNQLKEYIKSKGLKIIGDEPLKITILPQNCDGQFIADVLRMHKVECEFCDSSLVVLMLTSSNSDKDYERIKNAIEQISILSDSIKNNNFSKKNHSCSLIPHKAMSVRQAVFSVQTKISVKEALGRICAMSVVSCPPAIPIIVSGEIVDETMINQLLENGITSINVVE